MKINKIEIDGFKGIGELAIESKNFNVIIGKNNTSKSSLLEAIAYAIFFNLGASSDSLIHGGASGLRGMRPFASSHVINLEKKESSIALKLEDATKKIRFYRPEEVETIKKFKRQLMENFESLLNKMPMPRRRTIGFFSDKQKNNSKRIKDELDELGKIIDKILSDDKQLHNIVKEFVVLEKKDGTEFLSSIYRNRDLPKPLDEWLIKKGYEPLDFYYFLRRGIRKDSDNPLDKVPISFINTSRTFSFNDTKAVHEIESYLKKSGVLDDIGKLKRLDKNLVFQKKNGEIFDIPYTQMGDGFNSLINIIAKIKNSEIILLEELETHMHPEYVKMILSKLIDFSKTKNMQFFITTHNFDVLDFLVSDIMKPDHQEYLDKELKIIRMESIGNEIACSQFDRGDAKSINDINDDLRGI